jgi:hypothetical protein
MHAFDTKATEREVVDLLNRDYRRTLLHNILNSLIREVEAAERQGIRLFDWRIEVHERAEIREGDD